MMATTVIRIKDNLFYLLITVQRYFCAVVRSQTPGIILEVTMVELTAGDPFPSLPTTVVVAVFVESTLVRLFVSSARTA